MKMTLKNLQFNLSPINVNASDSNAVKPEDVNVNINSEGASFGVEEISMEISIAELSSFCGKTTTPTAAPEASTSKKADEALDICRAIMHKIDDLKAATSKAPAAPTKSSTKKVPSTISEINNEDEYI